MQGNENGFTKTSRHCQNKRGWQLWPGRSCGWRVDTEKKKDAYLRKGVASLTDGLVYDWRKSRNQRWLLFTEINKTEAGAGKLTPNFLPCSLFWYYQVQSLCLVTLIRLRSLQFLNFFLQRIFIFNWKAVTEGQVSLPIRIKLTQVVSIFVRSKFPSLWDLFFLLGCSHSESQRKSGMFSGVLH